MSPAQVILRAAEILTDEATVMRENYATPDGEWNVVDQTDEGAKERHDEMLRIAASLEALARAYE